MHAVATGRTGTRPNQAERHTVSRWALLWAVVPAGLFLVLASRYARSAPDFDESIFVDVASSIAATGLPLRTYALPEPAMFFDHTPGWVYYMGTVDLLGADTLLLARLTALIAGAGSVALVYLIGLEVRGILSGMVAGVVLAVNPFFEVLSWFARMEVPLAFFLVLATLGIVRWEAGHRRWIWIAGLSIAAAVMLKEIALGFWLAAMIYLLLKRRWQAAIVVAVPALALFGAWMLYALALDPAQLALTLDRWVDPAAWDPTDPRGHISPASWAFTVASRILGWLMLALLALALVLWALNGRRAPGVALLVLGFAALAVASSFFIGLKEPRFLIAAIPMTAAGIGLLVDWGRWLSRLWGGNRRAVG
jgi:4-amino-4-deoxy-L-arabinose transferase-like glycosyltransferase